MATINFDANKNSIEGKSQVVLRTNPALSSNVKLVVDSSGDIYLDSFNANQTLTNQRYKTLQSINYTISNTKNNTTTALA